MSQVGLLDQNQSLDANEGEPEEVATFKYDVATQLGDDLLSLVRIRGVSEMDFCKEHSRPNGGRTDLWELP